MIWRVILFWLLCVNLGWADLPRSSAFCSLCEKLRIRLVFLENLLSPKELKILLENHGGIGKLTANNPIKGKNMKWTTPVFEEISLSMEVTAYVNSGE